MAVAEVVDLFGESGLVRAAGVFKDAIDGEGALKIVPLFLNAGGLGAGAGEPQVFRLGGAGG